MNGHKRKQNQIPEVVKELINELESKPLYELTDKQIFHPQEGYAKKIAESLGITRVQLRKVFQEFKNAYETFFKKEKYDEAMALLYRMYPLLEYQVGRDVINEGFKSLVFAILDNIERYADKRKENFQRAYDLLESILAYSKPSKEGRHV